MKKFLSILLAVMMVLSTVSFAAPSLAGTTDTAVELPAVEEVAVEEAELAASTTDEFGTLLVEINFDALTTGAFDFKERSKIGTFGGSVTADSTASAASVELCNGSGASYPGHTTEVVDKGNGDKYLKLTANANSTYNLIQLYTGSSSSFYTDKEGYLTVVFDYMKIKSNETKPFYVAYNRSQAAEAKDQNPLFVEKDGNWGTVISSFDEEQAGISGIGGNSQTMTSATMVNYIKLHAQSGVVAGDEYAIDNIRVYWRPKTVDVTIDVEGADDIVLNDYDTLGMDIDTLGAMLPKVDGMVFVGFSLEKDGALLHTTKFGSDCTLYPVYEERVALSGTLEFTDASDLNKFSTRNNRASFSHDAANGYLKVEFSGNDTGIHLTSVNIPAGILTDFEMKVRFDGIPAKQDINYPEFYYTTGGVFVHGTSFRRDFTDYAGEWITFHYTAQELGISDLTTFRLDFYDYMPAGSSMEIDYIRFIGKPVRVTVDNGDNATAPEVKMELTNKTTVAEVEAMYAKDHGDMKFVGLSRTPNGEVLAGTDLVASDGAPTTLYAVWDDYEYLTHYSIDFNSELEDAKKVRINQNSNDGTAIEWNEEGYISLTAVAKDGSDASWDHQIFAEAFSLENPVPAGVISQIAVRARYRNVPSEKKIYTVLDKPNASESNRTLDPANAGHYVYVTDATASKWAEEGHLSTIRLQRKLEEGEWFTYYVDAEKFSNGISFARIDTVCPMPDGMIWDVDYIRFLGDNQDERLPGAKYYGEFGEKVFEVDFDDAETGAAPATGTKIDLYGADINTALSTAASGITFTYGASNNKTAPDVTIAEKTSSDKYLTYTLNAESTYSYFFFSSGSFGMVGRDGYYIATFDFKSDEGLPMTFRMNKNNLVQDTAENFKIIENGEWDKAILYYDAEMGSYFQNDTSIASSKEVSIVKWHPTSSSKAGQTVAIDNFTLWFVPKTVEVTVDLSAYGLDNVVIKDYPTKGMSRGELEATLPKIADYEITGLALEEDGEALYQNRIAYNTTLYPVYEKVNVLDYSVEFNSANDISKIGAMSANALRNGKNSALTLAQQYVVETEGGRSFLRLRNQSAHGETGAVVDYGFWVANPIVPADIKEIIINMRIPEWAEAGKYTREPGSNGETREVNFDPTSMQFQLYFMDAEGKTVMKEIKPKVNAVTLDGEWFTYSIDGSQIPSDAVLFRFDPPDFIGHGTVIDVDYIRFYGEPIPDSVPLKWSADFNANANGVSLNSWRIDDNNFKVDDGVNNNDKGPGFNSKYLGEGTPGYITWNEDGYVTLNFDATEEAKAAAAENGMMVALYDPSIYVSALDKNSYISAGSFEELKIRMRLRNFPADGTMVYAPEKWGEPGSTEFKLATYPVYFHWMNDTAAVGTTGVQSKKFDSTCKFTEGSYVRDEWFEVTIPASFFEADVEDLATLRINLPDWTPDGAKVDIDYIKFMGKAPEASAPVTNQNVTLRPADGVKDNALRFKATVNSATDTAASDIGWLVATKAYLTEAGVELNAEAAIAANGRILVAYNRENGADKTRWFESDNDEALVFAAALKNVPAEKALETIVVRPVVVAAGEYFYGDVVETSLFDVAVKPYITYLDDTYTIENMVADAFGYDVYYNDGDEGDFSYVEGITEAQQQYAESILRTLLN